MPFRTAKTKVWQYDIQVKGVRLRGSCGTTDYETAKEVEAEVRRQAKRPRRTEYTLSEAFGTYHHDKCQHQSSAGTSASQARVILSFIPGKTKLSDMTDATVLDLVAKMRATRANGTVNRHLQFMGRAIAHMAKFHNADVPDLQMRAAETKEAKERVRELSQEEQGRLFEHLPEDLRPAVLFCLMTGARIETMAKLLWSDVLPSELVFRLKGDDHMTFPKTGELAALLSALPKSNVIADRRYVFTRLNKQTGERCRIVHNGGVFGQQWREALADAEIYDFRFHDLRHTFATRMLRQTNNLKLVSRLLGHKDIETTMRYAHVMVDDMRDALEQFSPVSGGVPQNKPQTISGNTGKTKA